MGYSQFSHSYRQKNVYRVICHSFNQPTPWFYRYFCFGSLAYLLTFWFGLLFREVDKSFFLPTLPLIQPCVFHVVNPIICCSSFCVLLVTLKSVINIMSNCSYNCISFIMTGKSFCLKFLVWNQVRPSRRWATHRVWYRYNNEEVQSG